MTVVEIRADLAEKLLQRAKNQNQSVNQVIENLLDTGASRAAEDSLRQLADYVPSVMFVTDIERTKTYYISPGVERILGISMESAYASPRNFLKVIHPDDLDKIESNFHKPPQDQKSYMEYRVIHASGAVRWSIYSPSRDLGWQTEMELGIL